MSLSTIWSLDSLDSMPLWLLIRPQRGTLCVRQLNRIQSRSQILCLCMYLVLEVGILSIGMFILVLV